MSRAIDTTSVFLYGALVKPRSGIADIVRFRETSTPCWRCAGHLETYYCEDEVHAVRCGNGCRGVFLVRAKSPKEAADEIAGTYVGEIPGGGVPGC